MSTPISIPDHRDSICLTGGAGFVGSSILRRLLEQGDAVSALVN